MNFEPNGNRVFVELDSTSLSSGGIHIPDTVRQQGTKIGTVKYATQEYIINGITMVAKFKPGDRVLIDSRGIDTFMVDGQELIVLRNEDVIGKFI